MDNLPLSGGFYNRKEELYDLADHRFIGAGRGYLRHGKRPPRRRYYDCVVLQMQVAQRWHKSGATSMRSRNKSMMLNNCEKGHPVVFKFECFLLTLLFCMFSFSGFFSTKAEASACLPNDESTTESFLRSDLVFKGVIKHVDLSNLVTTFKVIDWYKAPHNFDKQNDLHVRGTLTRSSLEFDYLGRELLVYAALQGSKDNSVRVVGRGCSSATKLTIKEQRKLLSTQNTPENRNLPESNHNFIAIGKLLKVTHEIGGSGSRRLPRSTLEFELSEILRNKDSEGQPEDKIALQTECGEQYRVGKSYVLYANSRLKADRITKQKNKNYRLDCTQIFSLDEEQLLTSLMGIKESTNGN